MKRLKQVLSFALTILIVGSALAGCASGSASNSQTSKSTTNTTSAASGPSGKIVMWDADWNKTVIPNLIKEFNKKYPNVTVDIQYFPDDGMSNKYLLALQQKNGPDVINMQLAWTPAFSLSGGLLDLTKYEADNNLADFYPGALNACKVNDKIYGLPYRSETHGLIYNKDLFKAAGLDPEKAPSTWDEVLADAKKLTKGGVSGFALPGKNAGNMTYQLFNMIFSKGGEVFSSDSKKSMLDQTADLQMANYYVDMFTKEKVVPNSILQNDGVADRNLFTSGKVAMYMSGPYDLPTIQKANPKINIGTGMIPELGAGKKVILGGWSVAATSYTKNPDAAAALVNFLTSADASIVYSNTFSARKSTAAHYADPLLQPFLKSLDYAQTLPAIPQLTQIQNTASEQLQGALAGTSSTDDAMKSITAKINDLLSQN